MLVEMCSVEKSEPVFVVGEMRGHPVQDDSDAVLMQAIDEIHEILGSAVPAGGREKAGYLVSPGTVEGMLHDGQEFHVGEARARDIFRQPGSQFAIGQRAMSFLPAPAARNPGALHKWPSAHCRNCAHASRSSSPGPARNNPESQTIEAVSGGTWRIDGKRIGFVHNVSEIFCLRYEICTGRPCLSRPGILPIFPNPSATAADVACHPTG